MPRNLFGGAMSMAIPKDMTDISLLRQVPDHQEVFADAQTDTSIIVEILESVPHTGIQALKYHYEQVSELNADDQPHFLHVGPLSLDSVPKDSAFILCGQQEAAKFNEGAEAKNTVVVCMALLRLPEHDTDILQSLGLGTACYRREEAVGGIYSNVKNI
ncbi:hypothetical protein GGH93_005367 [Coemansia aciculifera]|nr:hypothetical protein GGH93_005367 [Coemansia aciculifera]